MAIKLHGILLGLLLITTGTHANKNSLEQTKKDLQHLEQKITLLKTSLKTARNQHDIIHKGLANIDKKISRSVTQLLSIHKNLKHQHDKIKALDRKIFHINKCLSTQQKTLSHQIRTRYKMGAYQPLKWLLNLQDPNSISQILTQYQYLLKSHQRILIEIQQTKKQVEQNRQKRSDELRKLEKTKHALRSHQQKLELEKKYQSTLIHTLNHDIQSKNQTLKEYQQNKTNLTHLLNSLLKKKTFKTQSSFASMRHRLPHPVKTRAKSTVAKNQGLLFLADEGLAVVSVYPGKIVFSDWLRGYGLLLIIDHGHGFMTLYAHNQALFKQKGERVEQGEQIATTGHSGGLQQNGLYFEIRHLGKTVAPLDWLS